MTTIVTKFAPADHGQPNTTPAAQRQPTFAELLDRLPLDFTEHDIRACEDAILATGAYIYVAEAIPHRMRATLCRASTSR